MATHSQVFTDTLHQMIRLVYLLVNATLDKLPAEKRQGVKDVMKEAGVKVEWNKVDKEDKNSKERCVLQLTSFCLMYAE